MRFMFLITTTGPNHLAQHTKDVKARALHHLRSKANVYSFVARELNSRRRVVTDGDKKGIEEESEG
jgi:hypothetical protein